MRNFTIYLTALFCLFLTQIFAQESFESQVKQVAKNIENITKEEKEALKIKVEEVNVQQENGQITSEQANEKKQALAESSARAIEFRVAKEQQILEDLVQQKVDGKIKESDSTSTYSFSWRIDDHMKKKENYNEKRTTSQAVFAFGANNLVTDGSIANSEMLYLVSYFFEWGFTFNTRLLNNSNLLHLKYGLSLVKNNLRPSDNQYFVVDGNQTNLEQFPTNLRDSRFKNNYWVVPVHLEFDFAGNNKKEGKNTFRSQQGFKIGIGGYGGFNSKSKQKLYFTEDDAKVRTKEKKDFNANDFVYGVSSYIGYKDTSLYIKYDMSPLFKHNVVEQNNISLGLRWDWN